MPPCRIKAHLRLCADAGDGSEKLPLALQLYQGWKGLYDLMAQGSGQLIAAAVGACGRSRPGARRQDQEIPAKKAAGGPDGKALFFLFYGLRFTLRHNGNSQTLCLLP